MTFSEIFKSKPVYMMSYILVDPCTQSWAHDTFSSKHHLVLGTHTHTHTLLLSVLVQRAELYPQSAWFSNVPRNKAVAHCTLNKLCSTVQVAMLPALVQFGIENQWINAS